MSDILCIGLGNQYQGPFADFFKSVIAEVCAVQFFYKTEKKLDKPKINSK